MRAEQGDFGNLVRPAQLKYGNLVPVSKRTHTEYKFAEFLYSIFKDKNITSSNISIISRNNYCDHCTSGSALKFVLSSVF